MQKGDVFTVFSPQDRQLTGDSAHSLTHLSTLFDVGGKKGRKGYNLFDSFIVAYDE